MSRDERVRKLEAVLGIKRMEAVGLVAAFYDWVSEHRPDGDLTGIDEMILGQDIGYDMTGIGFMNALALSTNSRGEGITYTIRPKRGGDRTFLADYSRTHAPARRGRERVSEHRVNVGSPDLHPPLCAGIPAGQPGPEDRAEDIPSRKGTLKLQKRYPNGSV